MGVSVRRRLGDDIGNELQEEIVFRFSAGRVADRWGPRILGVDIGIRPKAAWFFQAVLLSSAS